MSDLGKATVDFDVRVRATVVAEFATDDEVRHTVQRERAKVALAVEDAVGREEVDGGAGWVDENRPAYLYAIEALDVTEVKR